MTQNIGTQPYWPQPAPAPKAQHMPWWGIAVIGLACFLLGLAVGSGPSTSKSAAPITTPAPHSATPTPYSAAPVPVPTPVVNGITNGVYKVGDEVAPGEYRSPGPQTSGVPLCYVHVKDGARYLEQKVSNDGQVRIAIPSAWIGAELDISGCQPFVKIG